MLDEPVGVSKVEQLRRTRFRCSPRSLDGALGEILWPAPAPLRASTVRDAAQLKPSLVSRLPHPDGTGVPPNPITTSGAASWRTETAPALAASWFWVYARDVMAIITGALIPHPTMLRTFLAMMAREFRVMGRNLPSTFVRSVMQPLLWVFVFTYVLPKIGAAARRARPGGGRARPTLSIPILLPGLMASMLLMQGIMATTFPLVSGVLLAAHDRGPGARSGAALAVSALQKIAACALRATSLGALIPAIRLCCTCTRPGRRRTRT